MTTTEGHARLERARDGFSQVAKEPEDEEPQCKRHRPEGDGEQPLAPSSSGVPSNHQEGSSSKRFGEFGVAACATACATDTCKTEFWNRRPK